MKIKKMAIIETTDGLPKLTMLHKHNNPGVWFAVNEHEEILEVAQSTDVTTEMEQDISWIFHQPPPQKIVARLARKLLPFSERFPILITDKNRTTAKWRHIGETSQKVIFYLIDEPNSISHNKEKREKLEAGIAVRFRAKFFNAFGWQRRYSKELFKTENSEYNFSDYFTIVNS